MRDTRPVFWNPYIETLSRDRITKIQLKNLRELICYAQKNVNLYQEKLSGIKPEDIRSIEDLKKLPLIEKEDLRRAQDNKTNFLFGDMLGVPTDAVTHFRQTSGTTGKPVYVPESRESWAWRVETWCHILWMAGFREADRVFLPFGYNVYVAFWEGHYAATKLGCMVVPGGALDTRGRINKMLEVKGNSSYEYTHLWPSYGRRCQQNGTPSAGFRSQADGLCRRTHASADAAAS
jgi:phenylacetate-CoA ligase